MIILPDEIIRKILLYAHPVLNKNIQYDIINYVFIRKIHRRMRNCGFCNRKHRYPRHFRCN